MITHNKDDDNDKSCRDDLALNDNATCTKRNDEESFCNKCSLTRKDEMSICKVVKENDASKFKEFCSSESESE